MKKTIRTIIAMTLLLVMATASPMNDLANSLYSSVQAENTARAATVQVGEWSGGELYVSDVKVGMGKSFAHATGELKSEGYTILTDDSGQPADLNQDAGEDSAVRSGPADKVVVLGYKTTTDPKQAITDLAAMNMNGGYSVEEYKVMVNQQLETKIKPFINNFISTINEYRENLKKPKDSLNYKRADLARRMLNKLIDDDTGGKPLGDLLMKKTKYEMGDAAYNALSSYDKTRHADILTILMQANAKAVYLMELFLTKATDTNDDTWLDRFLKIDLDDLVETAKAEKPNLTTKAEVYSYLDKKYNTVAVDILNSILDVQHLLEDPEKLGEDTVETVESRGDVEEEQAEVANELEQADTIEKVMDAETKALKTEIESTTDILNLRSAAVGTYLDTVDYGDGTLLSFFNKDASEFSGDGIRKLYPLVASLTEGQIAGLEFLNFIDLVSVCLEDDDSISATEVDMMDEISIYDGVDREIYDEGGVAITTDALRSKAFEDEQNTPDDKLNPWTYAGYAGFALFAIGTGACKIVKSLLN